MQEWVSGGVVKGPKAYSYGGSVPSALHRDQEGLLDSSIVSHSEPTANILFAAVWLLIVSSFVMVRITARRVCEVAFSRLCRAFQFASRRDFSLRSSFL